MTFGVAALAADPVLVGLDPVEGPAIGGTAVTLVGANFETGATVLFDESPATGVIYVSDTFITCYTPYHMPGLVNVTVKNPAPSVVPSTLINAFNYTHYDHPDITSVYPNHGGTLGGDTVVITGENFLYADEVTFGAAPASFVVNDEHHITAITPPHNAETVHVMVHTPYAGWNWPDFFSEFYFEQCQVTCNASATSVIQVNGIAAFDATATGVDCYGPFTFVWTFGDGTSAYGASVTHAYSVAGVFTWTVSVSAQDTVYCYRSGTVTVQNIPIISNIQKAQDPFRIKIFGQNFHPNSSVFVNGVQVSREVWKSFSQINVRGDEINAMLQKGVPATIVVKNNDDDTVSEPFTFVR